MEEGKSLDELLDEQNEAPEIEETPETVAEEAPASDRPRDESGRFAKKGEPEAADDGASPAPGKSEYDGAATVAERRRRQEAEERIAMLERQLQEMQNPPPPPPSIWEDENQWQQHFGGQVTQTAVQQASLNARLDMSEMLAGQAHEDFEEKKALFLELAAENPQLRQEALQHRHPWQKAYDIARNHATMRELNATSIDDLKAKIRAEIEAEMGGAVSPSNRMVPPSLSTERNAGARGGPAWSGPKSLEELLR